MRRSFSMSATTPTTSGINPPKKDVLARNACNSPVAMRFLGSGVRLDRRARADQVLVAVDVVQPAHRRPELVLAHPARRIGGVLARIGPFPAVGGQHLGGVGGALEHVVVALRLAGLDLADL